MGYLAVGYKKRLSPSATINIFGQYFGADDQIRTGDLRFTKAPLYQLSYVGKEKRLWNMTASTAKLDEVERSTGAGNGNRTRVSCLGSTRSTTELHPHLFQS